MKNILRYKLRLLLSSVIILSIGISCSEEEDDFSYVAGTDVNLATANSFLQVSTPVVSFQAGTAEYPIAFNAIVGGLSTITKVDVYNTFNDAVTATGLSSEPVLLKSYTVGANVGERAEITDVLTYDDLKTGISIGGNTLPASDFDLTVGAGWVLNLRGVDAAGAEYDLGNIQVAVLSPFAGLYTALETGYFRIGVESGLTDWSGQQRFIGSIDEFRFSYNDYWGPFAEAGSFEFSLADDYATTLDYSLTVLDDPSQLFFSGDDMLTCQGDAGQFVSVPCVGQNILIPDFVDGKHIIKLTYGYYTASGDENEGAREFYEILQKL